MDEREAFEAWAISSGYAYRDKNGLWFYRTGGDGLFEAWEARAAIAESAEECLRSYVIALAGAHKLIAELEAAAQPQVMLREAADSGGGDPACEADNPGPRG